MDDNQQNERQPNQVVEGAKAAAKTAAKTAIKQGSSIVLKYIGAALAPILPYIIGVILLVVLFFGVYLGIENQADEILTGTGDLAEKVGNVLSGYGFKNEDQVEEQEEEKFYKKLEFYKKLFSEILGKELTNYELALIQRTLLYEGNAEDRVYYTEDTEENSEGEFVLSDGILSNVINFMKSFNITYVQGFTNSFMGTSKFKKRNKMMNELVVVVYRCQRLTGQHGGQDDFNACYRGYLVADFDLEADKLVDENKISYNIKPNYLVYDSENFIKRLKESAEAKIEAVDEKVDEFWYDVANNENIQATVPGISILVTMFLKIDETLESIERINDILFSSKLAQGNPDEHFYYRGYISTNLREYYKGSGDSNDEYYNDNSYIVDGKFDEDKFNLEVQLREEIATDIFDFTDSYYMLEYGEKFFLDQETLGNLLPVMGSNEKNISVEIEINGQKMNISFDEYVMVYAMAKYSDKIDEILKSDKNVQAQLEALMIVARTEIYSKNDIKNDTVSIVGDSTLYQPGVDGLEDLTKEQFDNLKAVIESSRGTTIKSKGSYYNISDDEINAIIDKAKENGNSKDSVKDVFPDADMGSVVYPLDVLIKTSDYGENRGGEIHKAFDFTGAKGTAIYSMTEGVIVDVVTGCKPGNTGCGGGFGNRVYIRYDVEVSEDIIDHYYVIYAHLDTVSPEIIAMSKKEQESDRTIGAGVTLGGMGNTGSVDPLPTAGNPNGGTHLHLEVRKNDTSSSLYAVNPEVLFGIDL